MRKMIGLTADAMLRIARKRIATSACGLLAMTQKLQFQRINQRCTCPKPMSLRSPEGAVAIRSTASEGCCRPQRGDDFPIIKQNDNHMRELEDFFSDADFLLAIFKKMLYTMVAPAGVMELVDVVDSKCKYVKWNLVEYSGIIHLT